MAVERAMTEPSSIADRIPLLNSVLEIGMCDDAILDGIFEEL